MFVLFVDQLTIKGVNVTIERSILITSIYTVIFVWSLDDNIL